MFSWLNLKPYEEGPVVSENDWEALRLHALSCYLPFTGGINISPTGAGLGGYGYGGKKKEIKLYAVNYLTNPCDFGRLVMIR